jgi:polyhydroxyalkanoate synthesis regulator phasin
MRKVRIDRDWRKEMTPEERAEVARLEREISKIERQVLALRNERKKIQNRATVRAGK